jgi:hypothetical protein
MCGDGGTTKNNYEVQVHQKSILQGWYVQLWRDSNKSCATQLYLNVR